MKERDELKAMLQQDSEVKRRAEQWQEIAIAMLVDDSERIEQGSRLHRELLQLVTTRLGLLRMPAGEIISEGDWTSSGMARAMNSGASLRDDLAELGRLRGQVTAYQEWSKDLADYIVEHHKPPMVDDKAVAVLDGYHVGLTEVAGPRAGGENTLAAAVRLLKLAASRGAFMLSNGDATSGDLLELADDIELNLDRTVEPEAARQNIALFRRAAATIEAKPFEQDGVRAVELVGGAVPTAVWQVGDMCTVDGEAQDVFRIDRLGPWGAALVNSRGVVHGWEGYSKMHKAMSVDTDMAALVREHAAKPLILPASTRTEIHGATGDARVTITTSATGEIVQVTCHDVGPEPEEDDGDTLAERCKVGSDNLSALLGPIGGTTVPEPLRSGVIAASILLGEAALALRSSEARFWVVDEYNDNEGETFGIAIPADPQIDEALARWATTYDAVVAREEGREPHRPDPYGVELGGSGDKLTFRPRQTDSNLEALGEDDENGYSARIRMLRPEGVAVLLKAIAAIPAGGSLALYKGQLSVCYSDGDEREPTNVADLWELCDDMFTDDGLDLRGDHHHPDDMALGEDDIETEDDLDES